MRENLLGIVSGTISSVLSAVLLAVGGPMLPAGAGPQPEAPTHLGPPTAQAPASFTVAPPVLISTHPDPNTPNLSLIHISEPTRPY